MKPLDPPDLRAIQVHRAQRLYRLRRERVRALDLDPDLFGEPAWDLLLDLYVAAARERPVSVSDASLAADVPASTALRWITRLERAGAVVRTPDPLDGRRSYITLSERTRAALDRYLNTAQWP